MDFLALCKRTRELAGIAGTGPATVVGQVGELGRLVNWVAKSWIDIQNLHKTWNFLITDLSFQTVASQGDYTLSDMSASTLRQLDMDSLRCQTVSIADRQFMEPWDWTPLAPSAKKFESMLFFWDRGFRPLAQWQIHWIEGRRISEWTPAKKAREDAWNAWMVAHVLPGTETTPLYAQVYPRIRRMPMRSAHDWALPERWCLMRDKMPWLHLAAAWHNDTCWLPAKAFHDPAWCDYAALLRLQHPQSFRAALPDVAMDAFIAPMQATLEAGHSVGWTWPMLLAHLEKPDNHNEESLALPGDLLDQ